MWFRRLSRFEGVCPHQRRLRCRHRRFVNICCPCTPGTDRQRTMGNVCPACRHRFSPGIACRNASGPPRPPGWGRPSSSETHAAGCPLLSATGSLSTAGTLLLPRGWLWTVLQRYHPARLHISDPYRFCSHS